MFILMFTLMFTLMFILRLLLVHSGLIVPADTNTGFNSLQ